MNPYLKSLLLITPILASCGNSGGSSDSPTTVQTHKVSVSGTAIKGILAKATVTAKSLDGSKTYGTVLTADDGTYSLADLDIGTSPVLVELTTNSNTKLTCDSASGCKDGGQTHNFGAIYAYNNPAFKLTAVLPGVGSTDTSARLMITPITHMAAQRALKENATSAADIEGINRATAKLMGLENVDITTTKPSDITNTSASGDDASAKKYGALVAAFATLAGNTEDGDLTKIIDDIANEYATNGSLKANTTTEGEIALANVFTAASESATKAGDNNIDLGDTGTDLALDSSEAEAAEPDSVVTADPEPTTPPAQLTQAQATQKGIDLLNGMNNWYTTLTDPALKTTGDAYAAQIQAASDLMPAFDDTASDLTAWSRLVVSEETECVWEGTSYNQATQQYESVCYEYGTNQTPGILFGTADVTAKFADYARFLELNHGSLATTQNGNEFTITTTGLGDQVFDLDLVDLLEDDNGNIAEGAEITATYTWDTDHISSIRFYGTGNHLTIASQTAPVQMTYSQSGTTVTYAFTGLSVSTTAGTTEDFDTLTMPAATLALSFSDTAAVDAFLNAHNTSAEFDGSTLTSVMASMTGNVTTTDNQKAAITFSLDSAKDSSNVVNATASLKMEADGDNNGTSGVQGTFTANLTGTYVQSGDAVSGLTSELDNVSGKIGFEGNVNTTDPDNNSLEFTGNVAISAGGYTIANDAATHGAYELDGTLTIVNSTSNVTTAFDGSAAALVKAVKTPEGQLLILNEDPVFQPYELKLSGKLSTGTTAESAAIGINGVVRIDSADAFTVSQPELPQTGQQLATTITIAADGADASTLTLSDTLASDLATQLNISQLNPSLNYFWYSPEISRISRQFVAADSASFVRAHYNVTIEYSYGYTTEINGNYQNDFNGYNLYDDTTPEYIGNVSMQDVAMAALQNQNVYFYTAIEGNGIEVDMKRDYGTDVTFNNFVASIPLVVDWVWADERAVLDNAETDDHYRQVSVALSVDGTESGLDDAKIRISGVRNGLNDVKGTVHLSYNSSDLATKRSLDLNFDSAAAESSSNKNFLKIADADSEMIITATCVNSTEGNIASCEDGLRFGGNIYVGGFNVGTLEDRDGFPVFSFGSEGSYRIITPNFLVEQVQ